MKVSVITPSYHSEKYIRGNLESVVSQTYHDVEHIVIDGGSTDGTVGIFQAYPSLKWISQPDGGMYDAINKGLKMSSGEIVSYLNVDDRYSPGTIQTVVDVFKKYPDIDFVYGYCEYVNENGAGLFTIRPLPYAWMKYGLGLLWPQPSWFWRKRVHDKIGFFDARLKYVGDVEFMRRSVTRGLQGALVKERLSQFMLRHDCLTIKGQDVCERERIAVREQYQVDHWSWGRLAAEILFGVQNITSYQQRIKFRRLRFARKGLPNVKPDTQQG